jgi:UDP-N-acetylglucosamine diphosphorylase / glucose-1-phosphate thymidylyltransferase / UDP-N-acetylgalactosamine diphosphorylase / glucosamine-1-phosphate N-acetyltransferase / galactosamine-1-phosphate N-acetyltransferase
MRLILFDRLTDKRYRFHPLALGRPVFELICGMTSLRDKLVARVGARDVAYFVPPYMAESYRGTTERPVNDPATLANDDLLLIDGRVKADSECQVFSNAKAGAVALDADGEVLVARIPKADLARLNTSSLDALLESAKKALPAASAPLPTWNYLWELILANSAQLAADFASRGQHGIEGTVESPHAIRGDAKNVYIAPGAVVHPMVVIDAEHGPVYIDEDVEVHPFTRIEGPCYVGRRSILLGCKCREGNSIGPMCRLGGEVEGSIIHGYSNKYHDGFLGHAYVGQWVNLGAMTTNSDLKNDYSSVSVILDGRTPLDTGSTKVGSLIGDHAKTSIGTLLNTGAYVGAMAMLATPGRLLPKFLPSFGSYVKGQLMEGFSKERLYATAKIAMSRRGCPWTDADKSMWDAVYAMTAAERERAMKRRD